MKYEIELTGVRVSEEELERIIQSHLEEIASPRKVTVTVEKKEAVKC